VQARLEARRIIPVCTPPEDASLGMSSASGMPSANLLSGLPDDLLVNMISFCGPRSCIHLRATSATFAAVTSSQSLWQHFCCREGIVDVE
jgi:hypothetical protein